MRLLCVLLAASTLVLVTNILGQDKKADPPVKDAYTIKLRSKPDAGKSITIKTTTKIGGASKSVDLDGKATDEKIDAKYEDVITETVLEKGDNQPKKFKRTYERLERTENGKAEPRSPWQGKTIVFELKDGKYEASTEKNDDVKAADLKNAARQAETDTRTQHLIPAKPVKVGDSWLVDKRILDLFGMEDGLDKDKSTAEAKLVKAYMKDGRQFGVIEVNMKMQSKEPKDPSSGTTRKIDAKLTLEGVIDGSSTTMTLTTVSKWSSKSKFLFSTRDVDMEGLEKEERSAEK